MNLLLLLSALLSALTGVGSTVRAPADSHAARSVVVATMEAAADTVAATLQPLQTKASLATLAAPPAFSIVVPTAPVPLYALRRRE